MKMFTSIYFSNQICPFFMPAPYISKFKSNIFVFCWVICFGYLYFMSAWNHLVVVLHFLIYFIGNNCPKFQTCSAAENIFYYILISEEHFIEYIRTQSFLSFFFLLGHTHSFLSYLQIRISPAGASGTVWDAGDQIWVYQGQGKCLTHCIITANLHLL